MRRACTSWLTGILVVLAIAAVAAAAGGVVLHKTKTFKLSGGKTKTFEVRYPDALKYKGSKYSGKVKVAGFEPRNIKKVKILHKGSCLGGSVFCVKVRNGNDPSNRKVTVTLTATTRLPAGKKP